MESKSECVFWDGKQILDETYKNLKIHFKTKNIKFIEKPFCFIDLPDDTHEEKRNLIMRYDEASFFFQRGRMMFIGRGRQIDDDYRDAYEGDIFFGITSLKEGCGQRKIYESIVDAITKSAFLKNSLVVVTNRGHIEPIVGDNLFVRKVIHLLSLCGLEDERVFGKNNAVLYRPETIRKLSISLERVIIESSFDF